MPQIGKNLWERLRSPDRMKAIGTMANSVLRTIVGLNQKASRAFDRLLPSALRVDGNGYFNTSILPSLIRPGMVIADVGGGKQPWLKLEQKTQLGITNIGIDIDGDELNRAPVGVYDRTYCCDICQAKLDVQADLVICQSVLEHVRDNSAAFEGLAHLTRPGGRVALFLPSRRAWFAWINRSLPESLKKRLLFALFPQKEYDAGFPAFYDRATVAEFTVLAKAHGFAVEKVYPFYISSYFSAFFPLYLIWRIWIITTKAIAGAGAAETFSMVLRRDGEAPAAAKV